MAKKPMTLDDLERELREDFQRARRRLDMVERLRTLVPSLSVIKEFAGSLARDDELTARKLAAGKEC